MKTLIQVLTVVSLMLALVSVTAYAHTENDAMDGTGATLPDQVTIETIFPGLSFGAPSYFDVTVSGGTTLDGTYDSYCVDTDRGQLDFGPANVYSSYDPLPPSVPIEYPENLDLVNWIINQGFVGQPSGCDDAYTYGDVQWAIWQLVEDNPPADHVSLGDWSLCRAQEILDAAFANGEGFLPGCGDLMGIILDPVEWRQPVLIWVEVPCACDLAVTKSCLVTPEPTTDLFCSDKIVATTLRYIGPTIWGAMVEIDPDKSPTVVYSGVDLISGETVLTLPAESGFSVDARPDEAELGSKTKIRVNGVEEVIHTSCSTPYVAGQPAPLDNPKGDPSPNWFVENFVDKDSPDVVELPAPPEPSDTCDITQAPTPSCETEGKPNSLTFRFTDGTCADSANTQGSKFSCTDLGTLDPTQPAQIVMLKDADKIDVTPPEVSLGDQVKIARNDGADFASETILEIRQGSTVVQRLTIHTSCSAPLVVGDVFGGLELVAFNGASGGAEVTYLYEVINLGSPLTDVTLTDRVDSEVVFSAGPFDLLTSDPVTFQWVTQIAETTINEATFSGFLADGRLCEAADTATVTVVEPCAECKGGTTELTFQYLGAQAADVVVYDDNDAKPDKILFEGLLQLGDEFTITPRLGQDDLNNDISIWVEGVFNAKVHTSCSKPIGPGLIAGDFLILEGRSKDNGLMCPLNTCDPSAAPTIVFHDKEIRWDVTNVGDLGLEISRIEISWPAANGYLDEVKRDGDAIHKGDFLPPSAVIDSGWEGNPDKRTIKPGETDTLKFKFQNDASMQGEYSLRVEFTYGCSIEVTYEPGAVVGTFDCSKPIDALTMIWDGSATDVWVTAWKGSVGSTALATLAPVSFGNALTVSGFAGSPNDVYWEIFSDASGNNKLGESTFHLSCSDDGMDGAEDCGTPQGDGKDKAGFLNDWLLEGLVDSDETLICTP